MKEPMICKCGHLKKTHYDSEPHECMWGRSNDVKCNCIKYIPQPIYKQTEPKCMSDRTYNYIQQIEKRLHYTVGCNSFMFKWIYNTYKDLRVDGYFSNCNPRTISAGLIYLASIKCGHEITQRDLSDISETGEATIRNAMRKIIKETNLNVNPIHEEI